MTARSHHVAILGCGIIGLSTGLAILEAQLDGPSRSKTRVTIVAKELPGGATPADQKHSVEYASVWAGGHHVSDAKTERELRYDKVTFDRMSRLAQDKPWRTQKVDSSSVFGEPLLPITKPAASSPASAFQGREPLVWVHQTELFERRDPSQSTRPPYQGVLDWYPDFKELPPASLAPRFGWGCTFSTIDINVPVYLDWLLERFLQLGGRVVVSKANSLQHAVRIAASSTGSRAVCRDASNWTSVPPVDALVVSPGLGARSIDGINDLAVHPQRGQVVVVNAPWLSVDDHNRWQNSRHELPGVSVVRPQGGREVYVIPRGDGTVVCGGTRIVDEWDPTPRAETTKTILERCLKIMPQLVDPRKRNALIEPRVEDIEVLGVNVGLRPARRGGVRLEKAQKDVDGAKVIFNYGYGGAGYQASWGAALEAKKDKLGIAPTTTATMTTRPDPVTPFALNTPLFNVLAGKRVVLASSSPRRKQILASVGLEPEIVPSTFEEDLPKSEFTGDAVYEYPVQTGSKKALEVYKRLVEENPEDPPDFVISADTVVVKDEVIMEKPADAQDNLRMLADLNGNKCEVVTGVTVIWPVIEAPGFQMRSLCERTVVRFADNPYYLLKAYVDSNEGIDRAGGFAIQGRGSLLVRCIEGDYNNVVGFPLYAFSAFLHDLIENDELDMVQDD